MDTSRNVVKRHQFADYLNTQSADKPNYCLMGVGFTSLNEEPGAQTESKKYVNEKASSKSTAQVPRQNLSMSELNSGSR